jgi:hypothetical protein
MLARIAVLLVILVPVGLSQQIALTDMALRTDPVAATVRPLETIPVQAIFYGMAGEEKVRIRLDGATWALSADDSGWLSKPYHFQGEESEPFYEPPNQGLSSIIFRRASTQFIQQESVVYTAPARPGVYEVSASLNNETATIQITVSEDAPSLRPDESISFPPEPTSNHPYRALAEHWAPFIAQETWFTPKADYLARFDLDGDWQGDNNWDNAFAGSSQAYVYYAAMETKTHWFLIYNMFHPRDYSDKCVAGSCHENDNEGLILTVLKDGSRYGALQTMETLAHNNVYSHVNSRSIRSGLHNVDGGIEFWQESHPVAFIESGGHGVYGSTSSHSRFTLEAGDFSTGSGVTYVYKGQAESPAHPDAREVGYQLLPIYHHWWLRAQDGSGREDRTFDAYYTYIPAGNRPRSKYQQLAGSFYGRAQSENKAKPFWGWHDNRSRKKNAVATGQWGLDPAYSVSQNLRIPGPFSLDYIYNPYLGIGTPPTRLAVAATPVPVAAPTPVLTPTPRTPSETRSPVAATAALPGQTVTRVSREGLVLDWHIEALEQSGYEFTGN